LGVATLAGFAGRYWWLFDLFSHFRIQYLVCAVVLASFLLVCRRFWSAVAAGAWVAINVACVLPYYLPAVVRPDASLPVMRAATINVNTANQRYDLVSDYVRRTRPDVLLLVEVNGAWVTAMEGISADYPYQRCEPQEDNFGIAIYSRSPWLKCETVYLGEAQVPSLVAVFDIDGQTLTVVGTHALPPIDNTYSRLRNSQIGAVADYLASVSGPKMLLGDLNASPWSSAFGSLLVKSSLRDSSLGMGLRTTWPANSILLRLPIDFCLVSNEILVRDRWIGPDVGSDHYPLAVDFCLRSPAMVRVAEER
jgi:endonuclease/exonuclease/phosphatase (EEP) superfamily protein YafD